MGKSHFGRNRVIDPQPTSSPEQTHQANLLDSQEACTQQEKGKLQVSIHLPPTGSRGSLLSKPFVLTASFHSCCTTRSDGDVQFRDGKVEVGNVSSSRVSCWCDRMNSSLGTGGHTACLHQALDKMRG
jgi:hypothetical protein